MVCLETTFMIDFLRGREEARIFLRNILEKMEMPSITSPTIMELISGAENNESKKEKKEILSLLPSLIILSLDKDSSILAGEIEANLILQGETIQPVDIMIGAICIKNNETLVTKNIKHFQRIKDLKIETY